MLILLGYLVTPPPRKNSSKGSSSEMKADSQEEKENFKEIGNRSLGSIKISKVLVENSLAASEPEIASLMEELDGYVQWDFVDKFSNDAVKVYDKGKKKLRAVFELKTEKVLQASEFIYELSIRTKWEKIHAIQIKIENDNHNIVQLLHPQAIGKIKYIEYIIIREVIKKDENTILFKARSILLPPSSSNNIKRVHINALVAQLQMKIDTEGQKYVECQIIWKVDEGYTNLAEYGMCIRKESQNIIGELNKLFEKT